ncbi:MAG: hypothetical protein AAFX99_22235 [Myxococcota bacterium]
MQTVMLTGRFRRTNHTMITRRLNRYGVAVYKTFCPYADAILAGTNPKPMAHKARLAGIPVIHEEGVLELMAGVPLADVAWNTLVHPKEVRSGSQAMSDLRTLAHDEPSPHTWLNIRTLVDQLPPEELKLAVAYLKPHMKDWPLFLTSNPMIWAQGEHPWSLPWPFGFQTLAGQPPTSWLRGLERSQLNPRFELIRALDSGYHTAVDFGAVLNNPALTELRSLRLGHDGHGPHITLDTLPASPPLRLELLICDGTELHINHVKAWFHPKSPLRHFSYSGYTQLPIPDADQFAHLKSLHIGRSLNPNTLAHYAPLFANVRAFSAYGAHLQGRNAGLDPRSQPRHRSMQHAQPRRTGHFRCGAAAPETLRVSLGPMPAPGPGADRRRSCTR